MKKKIAVILAIIVVSTLFYLTAPAFSKQGSTYITDFSVSEDGKELTITVGVAASAGYIRKVSEHQQHGGKLYLDCYSLNSESSRGRCPPLVSALSRRVNFLTHNVAVGSAVAPVG